MKEITPFFEYDYVSFISIYSKISQDITYINKLYPVYNIPYEVVFLVSRGTHIPSSSWLKMISRPWHPIMLNIYHVTFSKNYSSDYFAQNLIFISIGHSQIPFMNFDYVCFTVWKVMLAWKRYRKRGAEMKGWRWRGI